MTSPPDFDDKRERARDTDSSRRQTETVDPSFRARIHRSLGQDPGDVRIHIDPEAQAEAAQKNARALTRKKDVYFARDEYRPGTEEGNRLLAHELAHTIQQSNANVETGDRRSLEEDADSATASVMRGRHGRVGLRAPQGAEQLREKGKATVPTVQKHPDEISPAPAQGTVAGAGMTVSYLYSSSAGAIFVSLVLQVPEGTAVVATPLTDLHENVDYRVQNAGGTKARSVIISVSNKLVVQPKMQVTFTRGSAGYVVVFQFPSTAGMK